MLRFNTVFEPTRPEPDDVRSRLREPTGSGPDLFVPAVVRTDRLATLMHPEGVERLRGSALAAATLGRTTPTETDLAWLQALVDGWRVADIAREWGYSERAVYRRFRELWDHLGVQHRAQGVAVAVHLGLVEVHEPGPTATATRP